MTETSSAFERFTVDRDFSSISPIYPVRAFSRVTLFQAERILSWRRFSAVVLRQYLSASQNGARPHGGSLLCSSYMKLVMKMLDGPGWRSERFSCAGSREAF